MKMLLCALVCVCFAAASAMGDKAKTALYMPNEAMDTVVRVDLDWDRTPQGLLAALIDAGVVPAGTGLLSMSILLGEDGSACAALDLSDAFGAYLGSLDADKARLTLGSLKATYMGAYRLDDIAVRCAGETI